MFKIINKIFIDQRSKANFSSIDYYDATFDALLKLAFAIITFIIIWIENFILSISFTETFSIINSNTIIKYAEM